MNNNKMMLIYGFEPEEKLSLDKIVSQKKVPSYKVINSEMSKMKIDEILDGYKFEIYNEKLPKEKVVLFNNFNDKEINATIKYIKEINKSIIMAVITPTSKDWTFDYLIDHLIEEREWYKKNSSEVRKWTE